MLLPLFGSRFALTASMPGPLRWFAEHQPFTPLIETPRSLLLGTPLGNHATVSISWSVDYLWALQP